MMAEENKPVFDRDKEILPGGACRPTENAGAAGRVCVTYGRNVVMNKQVVSVIKDLGIQPLVMQDKKYAEKPLAEFVAAYPDIQFVVAILSADDWVYPKEGKPKDAGLRADQQVVFHLGYWFGKLGRERVFALYYDQRSFQWPTKFLDLIYTPLDKGGLWQKELILRLKQFGLLNS